MNLLTDNGKIFMKFYLQLKIVKFKEDINILKREIKHNEQLRDYQMIIMDKEQVTYISDITSIKRWLNSIAVVVFDVDEGQKVQLLVPFEEMTPSAEKELAMLAFPDSNSLGQMEGTFQYVFRNSNGLYGYTCFKQKKDSTNPRGYAQKSLVILTHLPFFIFFQKVAEFLVFKCFNNGQHIHKNLVAFCSQVSKWPNPDPLLSYILPVLDYQMNIQIPNYLIDYLSSKNQKNIVLEQFPKIGQNNFSLNQILEKQSVMRSGIFQQIKISQCFGTFPQTIQAIWMLTIMNKSFLIIGDNPLQVSRAVLAAVSIVNPIIFSGSMHPYVTVYDPKINQFENSEKNHILGGTNPLFHRLFSKMEIVNLNKPFKFKKILNLPIQFLKIHQNQQKKAIKQASIRKYFYRLNQLIIGTIDAWLNLQTNDLKFFNSKQFLKFMKARKDYSGLETFFQSKKTILNFFQDFLSTNNLSYFLKKRNVMMVATS